MIKLLSKIPGYRSFYYRGRPPLLPLNLTISLTGRCNSRCRTCNIWRTEKRAELSLAEYRKIFHSLGQAPEWLTMSGGEPFLREDIAGIVLAAVEITRPEIINIPTNGLLTDRIIEGVDRICRSAPGTELVINVSVDDIAEKDDEIRGVKSAYEKARKTFLGLKGLGHHNLTVGLHTVVSRFNIDHIEQVMDHLLSWRPDSYVTEIAEKRVELHTLDSDISPGNEEYLRVLRLLPAKLAKHKFKGISRLTQAIRKEYYALLAKEFSRENPVIPCFSAFSSAQIDPVGDVWNCCILALEMGNLRENNYDFSQIWFSPRAEAIRNNLKRSKCFCPLANAHYTSMMFHYPTLLKIGFRYLTGF